MKNHRKEKIQSVTFLLLYSANYDEATQQQYHIVADITHINDSTPHNLGKVEHAHILCSKN